MLRACSSQLAKLATCFTACHEFMLAVGVALPLFRLPIAPRAPTLNRISFNCTFFKCLVEVFAAQTRTKPKRKPVNNIEGQLVLDPIRYDPIRDDPHPIRFLSLSHIGLQFVGPGFWSSGERENVPAINHHAIANYSIPVCSQFLFSC